MEPVSPVIAPEFQSKEINYTHPACAPLPVHKATTGVIMSRWTMTTEERAALAGGADIFVYNWTSNCPLQPIRLEVVESDRTLIETAEWMGILEGEEA